LDIKKPYHVNKKLRGFATNGRKNQTMQEKKLWYDYLNKVTPRFHRQGIIDNYIVDFYCPRLRIVIEIDGFQHYFKEAYEYDIKRTKELEKIGSKLDAGVLFDAPEELLLQRLTARIMCRKCNTGYNKIFCPPKVEGVCDACGGELYQRSDDSLETAQNRLKVYREQTAPLIDFCTAAGLLVTIDSSLPKDEGYAALCAVLQ
jgi:very-short-patch-repair endonuclease